MSLAALYQNFLKNPDASILAEDAALHYVTTLTTILDVPKIVKQLSAPNLQKREQKILFAVEDNTSVALEVETTIHFVSSGGAYLPGLDDNFLADRVVTFPIAHFVEFDSNHQIQQIRITWDQGSLLKNIDVIGARGKNWPISDGKDHVRLIASSVAAAAKAVPATSSRTAHAAPASRNPNEAVISSRGPPRSPTKGTHQNVTRDPHASLALFGPRDDSDTNPLPAAIAPRASAKPPPRDYHDLFVGGSSNEPSPSASRVRNVAGARTSADETIAPKPASSKHYDEAVAPKGGAGKNYLPSRLFDHDKPVVEGDPNNQTERLTKPNPTKYKHFDFADGSDEIKETPVPISPLKAKSGKGASQWTFEDFSTPDKPKNKVRGQDVRHFGWSDDEADLKSPVKVPKVDKPRKDAETHFQFVDDGTPGAGKQATARPRGASEKSGLGLYENNLYNEDGSPVKQEVSQNVQPLSNVTNAQHRKVFGSQFDIQDDSPSAKDKVAERPVEKPAVSQHEAAVKTMSSNWDSYDQSPEQAKKENIPTRPKGNTGIMTSGDGMGGRKGTGRQWGFGDDSDGEDAGGVNGSNFQKGVPGKKQNQAPADNGIFNY